MSEHTPTTDEVRDYIRAADRVTAQMFSAESADAVEAFDRWLAAHDAEIRAGVVAAEPEWEYGYELIEADTRDVLSRGWPFDTAEEAKERADLRAKEEFDPEYPPLIPQVVRRPEAGPWVPVNEMGAGA